MRKNVVLDAVRLDHAKILELFDALIAKEKPSKVRWSDFHALRRELTRHGMWEEELLYAKLKRSKALQTFLQASKTQHATTDRLLGRLERFAFESRDWETTLRHLRAEVAEHMVLEETQLAMWLPSCLKETEILALGAKIKAAQVA